MISNPKRGWCDFKLGGFEGTPSYLTDVPIDLLNMLIDYRTKGHGMVWFDEEGTEFTLVLTPYSLFIIEEKDSSVLHDFSEMNIDNLEKELIDDIENDLDGWANFTTDDMDDEISEHKAEIIRKLEILKTIKNMKEIGRKVENDKRKIIHTMERVRCISIRESIPDQIQYGKKYWIDPLSKWKDIDGTEYAQVYTSEDKESYVGTLRTDHFVPISQVRYEESSLDQYINDHTAIMLKDIFHWCMENPNTDSSKSIIKYINDNNLNQKENMEKDYCINRIPLMEFEKRGCIEQWNKYHGYDLFCVD